MCIQDVYKLAVPRQIVVLAMPLHVIRDINTNFVEHTYNFTPSPVCRPFVTIQPFIITPLSDDVLQVIVCGC